MVDVLLRNSEVNGSRQDLTAYNVLERLRVGLGRRPEIQVSADHLKTQLLVGSWWPPCLVLSLPVKQTDSEFGTWGVGSDSWDMKAFSMTPVFSTLPALPRCWKLYFTILSV